MAVDLLRIRIGRQGEGIEGVIDAEAFRVGALREESEGESSRPARSRVPLDFLGAVLAPAFFGFEGNLASRQRGGRRARPS
jgi:hypothetical protein